jgi:hypothetical protein
MNTESTTKSDLSDKMNYPEKSPWLFRFFLRFFIFLFILLGILIGAGFVIATYYQDEVKEYIVSELNKQLNTQVIIDGKDIDFTVLKNFPLASVDFKNVKALDATEAKNKDTLFKAGEISMRFNIVDVFKKNYHVKKIVISDVNLRVRIDKEGKDNYHFWKESNDTTETSFSFALEKIILSNVELNYKNAKTHQNFDGIIKNSKIAGEFSNEKYSLNAVADLLVNTIKSGDVNYLRKKNIQTEFDLYVDNSISSYKIESGKLKIENMLLEIYGNIINAQKSPLINLGIKGKDMNIKSVLSLIPEKYKERINDYESNGEFYFNALIQGSFDNGTYPQITADFGIRSADITQVKDGIELKNVNLKGHYTNGSKSNSIPSSLDLLPFSASINMGTINGELRMKNLDNPSFIGKVNANTTLEEVQKFIKIDTIETIRGKLTLDASFSCDEWKGKSNNYENILTSGDLSISNANIKLKNNTLDFTDLSGGFKFDNNDLSVESFTGKISSSDFELKGVFKNMVGFILKEDQDINIEANLSSDNVNLNEILANKNENSTSQDKYQLKFSEHINVDLNARIKRLEFRKFEATAISGKIKLKDKRLVLDPVVLSTMDGTISTSGLVDGSDSTKLLVTCFSEVSRININKMFNAFENFGQSNITDKNIKGIATAKIQFASVLSPELQMDPDKLYAGVDMNIDNGQLNNVEAMKSLSRFIDLKELENIHFASLKNQIEIKKQVITIPKMEIKSTALNLAVSGTHNFNNDINYKIKLSLNELLSKKAKASKKENEEFGEIADDGLGRTNIFLSMSGNISDPVIRYDSKSAIQNVKQDLKVEKQNLKSILKDEFGLFKKDSTLNKKETVKKEDQAKFKINWEEADKKEEKKELKLPKKKEEDDF